MNFEGHNSTHNIILPVPFVCLCFYRCWSICLQLFVTDPLISVWRLDHLNLVFLLPIYHFLAFLIVLLSVHKCYDLFPFQFPHMSVPSSLENRDGLSCHFIPST